VVKAAIFRNYSYKSRNFPQKSANSRKKPQFSAILRFSAISGFLRRFFATFFAIYGFFAENCDFFSQFTGFLRKIATFFAIYGFFARKIATEIAKILEIAGFCGILRLSAKLFCLLKTITFSQFSQFSLV